MPQSIIYKGVKYVLASEQSGYKETQYSGTLYHGSKFPIKEFGLSGDGVLGRGLYLTTLKWARFYAGGGRIGNARSLKGKGHVYSFEVSGKAAVITDCSQFLSQMVSSCEQAEKGFSKTGDLYSLHTTMNISVWAVENGFDMVIIDSDSGDVVTFPHYLVVDKSSAKLSGEIS